MEYKNVMLYISLMTDIGQFLCEVICEICPAEVLKEIKGIVCIDECRVERYASLYYNLIKLCVVYYNIYYFFDCD